MVLVPENLATLLAVPPPVVVTVGGDSSAIIAGVIALAVSEAVLAGQSVS